MCDFSVSPQKILKRFHSAFPSASCSLQFDTTFQLLVATILSAQCTDVQVNKVTPSFFANFPSPEDVAAASREKIENAIQSTGFYRNKAKYIQMAAQEIVARFNGLVPCSMDELISLPGVGRKTANVVLSNGFGKNEGFVVDTHVFRISRRLGLSKKKTPEKVELDLMEHFPRKEWGFLSHAIIQLGRTFCRAQTPNCKECPLKNLCAFSKQMLF
ncbi:MAG: endonuclease III [Thermoguttaceae bacterium]